MAEFPNIATVPREEPEAEEIEFRTLKSRFEDLGHPSRKQKWLFPRRNITISHPTVTKAQGLILWAFYLARKGAFEAFNIFYPNTNTYLLEYVGTGDGATTVFNLPSKSASSYTLYVDGVAKTGGGTDYTFSSGGGADGADKVTFTAGAKPANGARVTWSFIGYLKIHGRFAEDKLSWEQFYNRLATVGIKIAGELNE